MFNRKSLPLAGWLCAALASAWAAGSASADQIGVASTPTETATEPPAPVIVPPAPAAPARAPVPTAPVAAAPPEPGNLGPGIAASAAAKRTVELPILVYHHVRPGSTSTLFVSPQVFDEQLGFLKENGFHTISFTDLADYLENGKALPPRPVIISLDDGWENQFENAFPLLQKYHDTATFYVVTNYLDRPNFLSVDQLKQMVAAGMSIGCHTRSHPALDTVSRERAWDEIAESKAILEADGFKIDTFAYPYGAYNAAVVAMVGRAGYRSARTVDSGIEATASDLGTLPGMTFQTFVESYRTPLLLTSGEAPR